MLICIGNDPANNNGSAVIDVSSTGSITFQYILAEQGASPTILQQESTVIIPGIDPIESWDFGNIYLDGVKMRNMPNVIHCFGACFHNNRLYVATGAHLGDESTFRGFVFSSDDLGQTWSSVQVSNYRCYDIVSFSGNLYISANNFQDAFIAVSTDDGDTWTTIPNIIPATTPRMIIALGVVVVIGTDGDIYTIDSSNNVTQYDPPDFSINTSSWNIMVTHGSWFYLLAGDKIYRTNNFNADWEYYCNIGVPCDGLVVWDGVGLIVSEVGPMARLFKVPLI